MGAGGGGGGKGGAHKAGGVQWCSKEQCITLTMLGFASTTGSDTHPQGKVVFTCHDSHIGVPKQ